MKIQDFSFIVIAKNEEFAIKKCLSSISKMELFNCKVICIDSDSSDKTLAIMRDFKQYFESYKIFKIEGYSNAAIARNVGIKKATKKHLFFVDGDIELNEKFILEAQKKLNSGVKAVTGHLKECQYSLKYEKIIKKVLRSKEDSEYFVYLSGGCFVVHKVVVQKVGFFNEKFEHSQDYEFTLRMTRRFSMLKLPESKGVHHTIPYQNTVRIKTAFKRLHTFYIGMLTRRNINNWSGLKELIWRDYGLFLGALIILGFIFALFFISFPYNILTILFIVLADSICGLLQGKDLAYRLFFHYVAPIYFLAGLLFDFDPRRKNNVTEVF